MAKVPDAPKKERQKKLPHPSMPVHDYVTTGPRTVTEHLVDGPDEPEDPEH
jgi:hypothetical protein